MSHKPKLKATFAAVICAFGLSIPWGADCERAFATIMPYPAKIAKLADQSASVLKVTVISVQPLEWAKMVPLKSKFWKVFHAKLKVVSTLKGPPSAAVVDFIYRSDVPAADVPQMWIDCGPENDAHFKLEPQKSYIIFVEKLDVKDAYIQTVQNLTMRPWEGFIRAADDAPVRAGSTVEQAIWNELTKQLQSKSASTSAYGAQTLFDLSCDNNSTFNG